jgi:hypothetical protein
LARDLGGATMRQTVLLVPMSSTPTTSGGRGEDLDRVSTA